MLLRALYDEHAAPLWRFVLHLTSDRAVADDVVQETLLRAWQRPSVLDQREGSARAWLFTVARNLVYDDRRSARFRREVNTDSPPEVAAPEQIDTALDQWLLLDAITTLSPDHRAVLVRSYYQGWGIAQIADDLDIPPGTVKSRLHYAVKSLRLRLQEMGVTR